MHVEHSTGTPFYSGNEHIFNYWSAMNVNTMPPWRNRLARSAVNRKVGGSSPPGGAISFYLCFFSLNSKSYDLGRIRTCNLLIRSQTRYPLRHETNGVHITPSVEFTRNSNLEFVRSGHAISPRVSLV